MYFWRSLLYLTILSYLRFAGCMVVLDCSDSEHLCPGSYTVELECTTVGLSFLEWNGNGYEIDFDYFNLVGDKECDSSMSFCGMLTEKPGTTYTSTLGFDSTLLPDGTVIKCIDLQTNSKSCQISHAAPPSPPSNFQYTQLDSESSVQFTWSSNSVTSNPSYRVTFTPSVDGVSTFNVTANNISLSMTSFQVNTEYIVEIKAMICDGELPGNESASITFTRSSMDFTSTTTILPLPLPSSTVTTTTTPVAHMSFSITSSIPSQSPPRPTSILAATETGKDTTPSNSNTESTTETTEDFELDKEIVFYIVSGAVGGIVVLIVMAIILVAFTCIIVVILKRTSQPNNNNNSPPAPNPQESTSQELAVMTLNQYPPPLPPRPAIRDFSIKVTNFSPLYDNPIHLYPTSSTQSNPSPQEYAIPMVARILIPTRNSETTFV